MLDYIRNNSQSLVVKIAFGIIILVFVFWGLGSVQSVNNSSTVVTVNGEAITIIDFERAYQNMQNVVRQENPQITPEEIKQMQLPQQVLQDLIMQALLKEEVKRLHMSVPAKVLRDAIIQMPAFKNAEGVFDPVAYKRMVEMQFASVGQFEALMREQLLETKLRQEVTLTAQGFPSEIDAFFDYANENRDVEYVFFPAEEAMAQVQEPAADSVKAYYESQRAAYTLPVKGDVEYVLVTPAALAKPEGVTAEAVTAYYEKNKAEKYTTPAQVKASHIILLIDAKADEAQVKKITETLQGIEKELKDGADFAELAKKHSQDTESAAKGGDLDWLAKGTTVPEFEKALFALKDGELSGIVRSPYGVHLIKRMESREESVKPASEVEKEIRQTLAEEASLLRIREALDSLIEANVLGKNLADAAKAHGLAVQKTGARSNIELENLLKITPEQGTQLMALGNGVPLDTAMQNTDKGYIVARMLEKTPATVRPFEEVQASIIQALKEKDALEKTLATAAEARKTYAEKSPEAESIKSAAKVRRGGPIGLLGTHAEALAALFTAEAGQWLPSAYAMSLDGKPGAVLMRVKTIHKGADEDRGPLEGAMASVINNQKAQAMFQLFLNTLQAQAEIEIINNAYLQALNER